MQRFSYKLTVGEKCRSLLFPALQQLRQVHAAGVFGTSFVDSSSSNAGGGSNVGSGTGAAVNAGRRNKSITEHNFAPENESLHWPRKIFTGIQPTGALHLGNYLGAVRKFVQMQEARDDVTICIVDMHSITLPQNPPALRENIFRLAATLIACGVDPAQSTLFVQSNVLEHSEFNWILNCLATMPRLGQLPQFKEKSREAKEMPLGLFVYPVLQAADIMLYKTTHVPVGADQLQHIQLAQHLARTFNNRYGEMFPVCHALIDNQDAARIRSLRDPARKMSKSDADSKSTISLTDEPNVIIEKIKKAVTDFTSDVSYDPVQRPGVSNLISIHALVTGKSVNSILDEAKTLDTGKYKLRVADAVIEHLKPIREQIKQQMARRSELVYVLEMGAEKARHRAQQTMNEVKQRLGLGTYLNVPAPAFYVNEPEKKLMPTIPERPQAMLTASQRMHRAVKGPSHHHQMRDLTNTSTNIPGSSSSNNVVNENSSSSSNNSNTNDFNMELYQSHRQNPRGDKRIRTRSPDYRPIVPQQARRIEKQQKSAAQRIPFEIEPSPLSLQLPKTVPFRRPDVKSTSSKAANYTMPQIQVQNVSKVSGLLATASSSSAILTAKMQAVIGNKFTMKDEPSAAEPEISTSANSEKDDKDDNNDSALKKAEN